MDSASFTRFESMLSADERQRQRRFRYPQHRLEHLATRVLVRTSLGAVLGVPPEALRFRATELGRPELDPPRGVVFSVANHPTFVCCAIGAGIELGIDVEPLTRGPEILTVAETVFTRAEREDLDADRAVTLWTLKESYIKARGLGFSLAVERISAAQSEDGAWRIDVPRALDERGAERFSYHVQDIDDHRVAIAASVPRSELHVEFVSV